MSSVHPIAINLWFDDQAEEAVQFYTGIFRQSSVGAIGRFGAAGFEHHGKPAGSVMTIEFTLNGQAFIALNGGPVFRFNEAVSLVVYCENQDEIDHYWAQLGAGGDPEAQQCGWLKDKYGLSWQVVPANLNHYMLDTNSERREKVLEAVFAMKKFDMAVIEHAYQQYS